MFDGQERKFPALNVSFIVVGMFWERKLGLATFC
jgi:hypothetical protein